MVDLNQQFCADTDVPTKAVWKAIFCLRKHPGRADKMTATAKIVYPGLTNVGGGVTDVNICVYIKGGKHNADSRQIQSGIYPVN